MSRLVTGVQPVREAIRAHGDKVERVWVESGDSPTLDALARFAGGRGIAVERASRGELDRRTQGARHQGAVALAPDLRLLPLDRVPLRDPALVVVLDGVQDPQNFGAVLRSSVALGADAVVWAEHASAPLTPATFRASAGAVEHAALCRVSSLGNALTELASRGLVTVGLDASATDDLDRLDLRGPVALVVGSEGEGLRRSVRRACTHVARLPMSGPIASLNASVAAALALYEVLRQRRAS